MSEYKNLELEEFKSWCSIGAENQRVTIEERHIKDFSDGFVACIIENKINQLHLHSCRIDTFSQKMRDANTIRALCLKGCGLQKVPEIIAEMNSLEQILLPDNELETFPTELFNIKTLLRIHLDNNKITHIPHDIIAFKRHVYLKLEGNPIQNIPPELIKSNGLSLYLYLYDLTKKENQQSITVSKYFKQSFVFLINAFNIYLSDFKKLPYLVNIEHLINDEIIITTNQEQQDIEKINALFREFIITVNQFMQTDIDDLGNLFHFVNSDDSPLEEIRRSYSLIEMQTVLSSYKNKNDTSQKYIHLQERLNTYLQDENKELKEEIKTLKAENKEYRELFIYSHKQLLQIATQNNTPFPVNIYNNNIQISEGAENTLHTDIMDFVREEKIFEQDAERYKFEEDCKEAIDKKDGSKLYDLFKKLLGILKPIEKEGDRVDKYNHLIEFIENLGKIHEWIAPVINLIKNI